MKQNQPCPTDDCDAHHCPRCGRHTVGRLENGDCCEGCRLGMYDNEEQPQRYDKRHETVKE